MADWWLELAEIFVPWRGIKEFYYAYFDLAYRWYEPTLLLQKKDETAKYRIVQHDNRRPGQNGDQNGAKKATFEHLSMEGTNGLTVSVGTSKLS